MTEPLTLAVRPNSRIVPVIAHEDADLMIVEKASGTVTQPGKGHANDSILNGVFAMRDGQMGKILHNLGVRRDYGLLHRLDKETSGLLVIAKTPNAYDQLRRDFEERRVDKDYLAIVAGIPKPKQGVVQARLKEVEVPNTVTGRGTLKKSVISRQGQEAITAYRVEKLVESEKCPAALIKLSIKTGRLHQIRAHMVFLNCQVLGDDTYAPPIAVFKIKDYPHAHRLCLHASRLGFKHPSTGKWMHVDSPLPSDLTAFAKRLGLEVA